MPVHTVPIPTLSEKDRARFWAKVERRGIDDCWEWTAYRTRAGYGRFGLGRRIVAAHRVAFTLMVARIPRGMLVCHTCDNPPCVNPDHLFAGTHADNEADSRAKGRAACGERSGHSRLRLSEVREIRNRYAQREANQVSLAREYGVSQTTISAVVRRHTWRHV